MKRFAFGVLAVCMVVLLVVSLNGGFNDVEKQNINYNEAAFTMPKSLTGAKDITSFLIGDFVGDDGSKLSFDGMGSMRRIGADGMVITGSYALLQQSDGSVMAHFVFEAGEEFYGFSLVSELGEYILQNEDGKSIKYAPILY